MLLVQAVAVERRWPSALVLVRGLRAQPFSLARSTSERRDPVPTVFGRGMKHYYTNVPRLGNVALSRHAQARGSAEDITDVHVADVLMKGSDTPDGQATWREHRGVRLVIVRPSPWNGAWLVTTMFRVERQAAARRR